MTSRTCSQRFRSFQPTQERRHWLRSAIFAQTGPRRHEDTEIHMLYGPENDNAISERIIGCAIEVHRELGPGLLESMYESALCIELKTAGLAFARQVGVPV